MAKNKGKVKDKSNKKQLLNLESRFEILRTLLAIGIAMGIVLAIVAIVSDEPLKAIGALLMGPFSSVRRFANVIELMIPLTFTGLAVTIIFKTKRFNLAGEGAFYLGAIIAAVVGIYSPLSPILTILLIFVLTLISGAIVGFIPTFLNTKFKANELVTSLMLNYIIAFFVRYILTQLIRDKTVTAVQSLPMQEGMRLPIFIAGTRIHIGLFIMLLFVVVSWLIVYKTKWGYALRATGANEKFAKYSGMKVTTVIVLAQVIGIAIASFGGGVEMLGMHSSFKWIDTPGYGFDGVLISTLAGGNPALVPLAAFFLAFVRIGAEILNRTSNIPAEIVSVVQATIILLIAAKAFLAKYKHKMVVKETGVMDEVKEAKE